MPTDGETVTPIEDCDSGIPDRMWQRLPLARPAKHGEDEGTIRRELLISHVRALRRGRSSQTEKEEADQADGATRYSLPSNLTPERRALIACRRAERDRCLSERMQRQIEQRQRWNAAVIASFWKKCRSKMQESTSRLVAERTAASNGTYHPWKVIWHRSMLCEDCGQRVSSGKNLLECLLCNQVAHRSCRALNVEDHIAELCGEIIQQIDEDKLDREMPVDSKQHKTLEKASGGMDWLCGHCLETAGPELKANLVRS